MNVIDKRSSSNVSFLSDVSFGENVNITGDLTIDGSFSFNEVIQNITTVNNELLVSTQLDISTNGTGPALSVTQYGDGTGDNIVLFHTGKTDGSAVEVKHDGKAIFYEDVSFEKGVEISGDFVLAGDIYANINADKITSGLLDVNRVPNLDANKITSGSLSKHRIPHVHNHISITVSSPSNTYPLFISGYRNLALSARYYNVNGNNATTYANRSLSAYFTNMIATDELQVFSDERIKKNIVDISDNLAYDMVKKIPCRYYQYRDALNKGTEYTIGFIAQEVKELLPMAVDTNTTAFIPNEYRNLENISWNNTILTSDLVDVSGIEYKFMVCNVLGEEETELHVVGNSDNTFTFEEKWNNVFCYGKQVDDFHTLEKNKLFALNFSATQEIIRKIERLEIENTQLKTDISTIRTHMGI